MKDLREAIFNVFNHSIPVKFTNSKEIIGYLVNKEHMDILLAEYNIHFIEPEDEQETLPMEKIMEINFTYNTLDGSKYIQ
jgi:hypothetical protein